MTKSLANDEGRMTNDELTQGRGAQLSSFVIRHSSLIADSVSALKNIAPVA
jgi:hypothetical protein